MQLQPGQTVVRQPHRNLFLYYALGSLLVGPLFFVPLIPLYFRYHTLRLTLDQEGVSMRWGILFRREISLTYARIQDIHLTSNLIERWLGLAKIQIQTASGSSGAEMEIVGLQDFEELRDFLYSRMRGIKHSGSDTVEIETDDEDSADVVLALREATAELEAIRKLIESRKVP